MSDTIKAKTIQRLSSKRRLSCPLRASLSPVRSTIFPLLILLLAVLADASYPSVLPPKPLYAPIVEKKIKKNKKHSTESPPFFFLLLAHPSDRGLMAPQA